MDEPTFEEPGKTCSADELFNDVIYRYWCCPVMWVPKSVFDFIKIQKYYGTFGGASMPKITEINGRFLDAYFYYDNKVKEFVNRSTK